MDERMRNIGKIEEFFRAGCKSQQLIGLELEHFLVDEKTKESAQYEPTVRRLLEELAGAYGKPIFWEGNIIGLAKDGAPITLEPAAQIEISIGPKEGLAEIKREYDNFFDLLAPLLARAGLALETVGYQPKSKIGSMGLLPKKRYGIMHDYFKKSGLMGRHMMKGTAAAQISIDYRDESDFKKKFRLANVLGPLFAFACDNSRVFEGEPFEGRMLRTQIWNNVCPARQGVVPGALDGDFGFFEYARYIYELPAVLVPRGGSFEPAGLNSFAQEYAGRPLEFDDAAVLHATTMAFPDVALKSHIEIRMADSMPIDKALAYAALIKGIFYDERNLCRLHDMTLGVGNCDVALAKSELALRGLCGAVYSRPAKDWLAEIFGTAREGLRGDEARFFLPLEDFVWTA